MAVPLLYAADAQRALPKRPAVSVDQHLEVFTDEIALASRRGYDRAFWLEQDNNIAIVRLSVVIPDNLDSIIHEIRHGELDKLRTMPSTAFAYGTALPAVSVEMLLEDGEPTDATFFPSTITLTDFAKRHPEIGKVRLHAPNRVFHQLGQALKIEEYCSSPSSRRALVESANYCAGVLCADEKIPILYERGRSVVAAPSSEPQAPWASTSGLARFVALYQLRSVTFGYDHLLSSSTVATIGRQLPSHGYHGGLHLE